MRTLLWCTNTTGVDSNNHTALCRRELGTRLFPVVRDRGQNGAEGLDAHGDVQEMNGEEEVVEVAQDGHDGVPDQIEEGLKEQVENKCEVTS